MAASIYCADSIVVCLHGCGDMNDNAIKMALGNSAAGYMVMPCCIEKKADDNLLINLSEDGARYNILCGVIATQYDAQLISAIDSRITNRPVMIGEALHYCQN